MTQYRQVPESTAIYWPSTIKYQLFSLYNSSSRKGCPSLTILHLNFLFKGAGARYWGDQRGGAWDQGLMGKTDQERNSQFWLLFNLFLTPLHQHWQSREKKIDPRKKNQHWQLGQHFLCKGDRSEEVSVPAADKLPRRRLWRQAHGRLLGERNISGGEIFFFFLFKLYF